MLALIWHEIDEAGDERVWEAANYGREVGLDGWTGDSQLAIDAVTDEEYAARTGRKRPS